MIDSPDLKQCTMRQTIRLNGGSAWFGYVFACVEHPRLQRVDKCDRKTKKTTIKYQVDGEDVASLDQAAERLNAPPVVTQEMRAALDAIGSEYGDHRKSLGYSTLKKLENCGLIEWGDRGMCRVTAQT